MNILLIGNGFDLAHGLPTLYKNFLDFCIKANQARYGEIECAFWTKLLEYSHLCRKSQNAYKVLSRTAGY